MAEVSSEKEHRKQTTPRRENGENIRKESKLPSVLGYESNNPQTAEESPDENGRTKPLVPGPKSYRDIV